MFRWLGWQWAIATLVFSAARGHPFSTRRHSRKVEEFPPTQEPYYSLARVWSQYASRFVPWYGDFLPSAGRHYGVPMRTVLDLACGTGLVTRQSSVWAEEAVGLDASEAMLAEARRQTEQPHVRYVQADFTDFDLSTSFDAVVCASDSLNYLTSPDQLEGVFRRVYKHLKPGGVFVFDCMDHAGFVALSSMQVTMIFDRVPFEVYYFYDSEARVSEARVVVGDVIERHRRVPLETEDVRWAAAAAGLTVEEEFSLNRYFVILSFVRRFYVLRKPV